MNQNVSLIVNCDFQRNKIAPIERRRQSVVRNLC